MSAVSSDQLRRALAALEAATNDASAEVQLCEAAHAVALTRSVTHADHAAVDKTEAALNIARAALHRAAEKCEEARKLLANALSAEREAFEAETRASISECLDGLVALAASADDDFAALVEKVRRLKVLETAIHADTRRDLGRSPWHAPMAYSALRPIASSLVTMANGVEPDIKRHVSTIIESARKNIEGAFRE